ncbi:MAG TPA: DUF4178 domain-containing protein [Gemmatimonadaceae bacterium]|nr:DUF4178 domain-containing protein [Gemmatimonadaceae bacterium]
MTRPTANCPNCGARLEFLWSGAVQTTCGYCRSILVRRDLDLEKVGTVADYPPDSSPIQIGTEGMDRGTPFLVVGRIIYEYERGAWNEWHLVMNDGSSAWLSDAQLEYALSRLTTPPGPLPAAAELRPGRAFVWGDERYAVTTITRARYRGVEGELPFEYWDKSEVPFADLATSDGGFATIDYSEPEPLLFTGRWVTWDQLALRNVRQFEGWPLP